MKALFICILATCLLKYEHGFQYYVDWVIIALYGLDMIFSLLNKDFFKR